MITVVDYGLGNLGSIQNMLKKIGVESAIAADPDAIDQAAKLILPGVGAFDNGMRLLAERGLVDVLRGHALERGTPILGICLGMQLMTRSSEEGRQPGLGWFDARTVRFQPSSNGAPRLPIPQMGWNYVKPARDSRLLAGVRQPSRFYFVHSYYVQPEDESATLTRSVYGVEYASAVERDNLLGVQFHPEKSHKFGMQLLANFAAEY